jgi:hypothetical protein
MPFGSNLVPKFYPYCFDCNFLIQALFFPQDSSLDNSLRVILFEMQRQNILYYHGFFDFLKMLFRASKYLSKLMTFKITENFIEK